ncbi:hypothetical protein Pint_17744 [Pistacia integerrima]|uniref:Uncharacterized protein n=1 Tax=Pistacia integerrima TaxID=434235 RepID=A0ACC0YW35_9ROSI|nr:hypothetical protein Pint_17744 [Pistacia integerrima]
MYYPSLVAYYIFFNASKVVYALSLLIFASFHIFILSETAMRNHDNFQELTAFLCEQKATNWVCLQFQDNPSAHLASNASFYGF